MVEAVEATWGSRGPADPAAFGEDAAAAAVYAFAEELCRTRRVGDERYAAVKGRFGDVGAVELVALVGYYHLVSLALNTFEIKAPDRKR